MTENLVPSEAIDALAAGVASMENVVSVEGDAYEITRLIERAVRAAAPYIVAETLEVEAEFVESVPGLTVGEAQIMRAIAERLRYKAKRLRGDSDE